MAVVILTLLNYSVNRDWTKSKSLKQQLHSKEVETGFTKFKTFDQQKHYQRSWIPFAQIGRVVIVQIVLMQTNQILNDTDLNFWWDIWNAFISLFVFSYKFRKIFYMLWFCKIIFYFFLSQKTRDLILGSSKVSEINHCHTI